MGASSLYYDGISAKGRAATVTITERTLRILCTDGLEILWPLDELRYVAPPVDGQSARFRRLYDQPDRLTLGEDVDLAALQALCPDLAKGNTGWSRNWKKIVLWMGAAAASAVFLISVAIPVIAHQVAVNLPTEFQEQLGERAKQQIVHALSIGKKSADTDKVYCTGPSHNELTRLLDTLTKGLDSDTKIKLEVLNLDIKNAFALPGGNILLFKGLLKDLKHPNELAGILAHEISHVHYRHPTEVFLKELGTYALIGLIFGDVTGGSVLAGIGNIMIGSAYGREAEREADDFGVAMMNGAGLNAAPLADFLDRLHTQQGQIEELFSFVLTHPASKERAGTVRKMSTGSEPALSSEEWSLVKTMCD